MLRRRRIEGWGLGVKKGEIEGEKMSASSESGSGDVKAGEKAV
jgi:hypothetical protein